MSDHYTDDERHEISSARRKSMKNIIAFASFCLKEMAQVVLSGRQELVKIQTIRPSETQTTRLQSGERDGSEAVPISRARRAASRLRSMKGTG